jgi:glycine betaine/proline transport system permease protein
MTHALGSGSTTTTARRPLTRRTFSVSDVVLVLCAAAAVGIVYRFGVKAPVDRFQGWVRNNQFSHPVFRFGFDPFGRSLKWAIRGFATNLQGLPWFTVPAASGLIMWWRGKPVRGVIVAVAACLPGLFGYWTEAMETLALMTVSVAVALLIGIPLGVVMATRPRLSRTLQPVLDAMQTVPATVYLLPMVMFFRIGVVPAAVATIIFALPPAVRLTALGLTSVPVQSVEAGQMFGSTKRQLLRKVQLPLALPSIATGVNQTIMMALGLVVLSTLVGSGGLGELVNDTLQARSPGKGLLVGLSVVAIATVLDRVSASFIQSARATTTRTNIMRDKRYWIGLFGALAIVIILGRQLGWQRFPAAVDTAIANPVTDFVTWVRNNTRSVTRPLNDFLVRDVLIRFRDLLSETIPGPVLVAAAAGLGWYVKGWKLAVGIICGLTIIGLMGTWAVSIETLVQVMTATVLSLLVAIPLGVFVGRRPRIEQAIGPFLDALQTIPSLIYTIPFVMIFTVSAVPGIIASVLYAVPAGIRVAALGIREVPAAPIEAATSFGATNRQVLRGVRLPLAFPSIMLAVNQVIMMVLSMVVIAGMTGSGALGYQAVEALTLSKIGQGATVGLSIVIMAMILDRLTQGLATRNRR